MSAVARFRRRSLHASEKKLGLESFCFAGVLFFSLLGTPILSADAAKNKINITYRLEAWTTTYVTGNFGEKYGLEINAIPFKTGIETNPDLTVRFLASVLDSGDILTNYKDVATQLISRGFARRGRKIKPSLFRASLDRTFEPNLSDGYILPILSGSWKGLKARKRVKGTEPDWSKKINEKYLLRAIELRRKTSPDISSKR